MTASGGSTGTGGRETVLDAGVHDASRGLDAIAARLDMSAPPPTDARPACGAAGFCNDIEAEYEAAYKQALACKPLARISCDQKAYSHLTCQSCQTWVNSSVEVDKIRVRWETLACDKCVRPCPLIAIRCINLTNGSCADPDKDGVGQCAEKGPVVGPPVITN